METPEFNDAIDQQLNRSRDMLMQKNDHYNPGGDKLRGFKATAILRNTTPQGALAGMMVKHTLSVYDMCESGKEYPIELWNEKISDHINYLLLLRAVVEEQRMLSNSEEALAALKEKLTENVVNTGEIRKDLGFEPTIAINFDTASSQTPLYNFPEKLTEKQFHKRCNEFSLNYVDRISATERAWELGLLYK